jgi:phage baseplate assembly protein W
MTALNKWRPGIGFRAVQINRASDQSAEVGIGIDASLSNDAMQIGYGCNLNIKG